MSLLAPLHFEAESEAEEDRDHRKVTLKGHMGISFLFKKGKNLKNLRNRKKRKNRKILVFVGFSLCFGLFLVGFRWSDGAGFV